MKSHNCGVRNCPGGKKKRWPTLDESRKRWPTVRDRGLGGGGWPTMKEGEGESNREGERGVVNSSGKVLWATVLERGRRGGPTVLEREVAHRDEKSEKKVANR